MPCRPLEGGRGPPEPSEDRPHYAHACRETDRKGGRCGVEVRFGRNCDPLLKCRADAHTIAFPHRRRACPLAYSPKPADTGRRKR